jgi:hypothetical protein
MKSNWIKRALPGLVLLFLAPILGELIIGHQAPLDFINPKNFLLSSLPYGLGALICRELVIRWKKGKMSLVFLGIAYGLYEEIAVIRSIINQNWHELEGIGQYNFWGGINWTYGLMLVHFHIAVSIVSSVFIAEAIFHKRRNERWLSNPMLIITAIGLALWIPAGFYMSKGIQSVPLYILGILAIILFVYAAKAIPAQPFKKLGGKAAKPVNFYILGLVNMILIFLGTFYEGLKPALPVMFISLVAVDIISLVLVMQWSKNGYAWTDRHKIALASGFLTFFIVLSAIKDLETGFAGYSVISAAGAALLILVYIAAKKRDKMLEIAD